MLASIVLPLPWLMGAASPAYGAASCGGAPGSYLCRYTCSDRADDVVNINAAIAAVSLNHGGTVSLAAGSCAVDQPIVFVNTAHVWLRGAGPQLGGTTLHRAAFALSTQMIAANQAPPAQVPYTNQDVAISDMTIDPGPLFTATRQVAAAAAGATTLSFPADAFAGQLRWCPPAPDGATQGCAPNDGSGLGVGVFDFSRFGTVNNPRNGASPGQLPALALPANGNVASIKADASGALTVQLQTPILLSQPVVPGDRMVLYAGGGNVDVEYCDGCNINNVALLNGSAIVLQLDRNFVVSNSTLSSPEDIGTFDCLGGLFIGANLGNAAPSNGIVANNTLRFTTMEVDSTQTYVSGNVIQGTACGGINGSGGAYDVFEGNIIHDSAHDIRFDGIDVPANHDFLVNQAMQIWNPGAVIDHNLVYGNGGSGILSGGANTVISHNTVYNNGHSGFVRSNIDGDGITVTGSAAVNTYLTANVVCNARRSADPARPKCIARANKGSQRYALDIEPNVLGVNVGSDNQFYPGYAGAIYTGNAGGIGVVDGLPQAALSVPSCVLTEGVCSTTVTWTSQGMANVYLYVWWAGAAEPAFVGSGLSGAQPINWIGDAIYVFTLRSDQGLQVASATVQPRNYRK